MRNGTLLGFLLPAGLAGALLLAGCSARTATADPSAAAPSSQGGSGAAPQGSLPRGAAHPRGAAVPQGSRRVGAISVPTVTVQFGALDAVHTVAGSVQPVVQSQVAAQVSGVVRETLRRVGDWVAAGDTVVQLDDTQLRFALRNAQTALQNAQIGLAVGQDSSSQASPKLQMQLQSAQSALDAAQKNYDSQKALFDLGGVTASAVDSARSQVQQAQATLEAAKTALDQNRKADTQNLAQLKLAVDQAQTGVEQAQFSLRNAAIKAPFAGQIASLSAAPGMYLGSNSTAFVLVSAERQVVFGVSPSDAPDLQRGSTVKFTYKGQGYPVRIDQAPAAPLSGVVQMVAALPGGATIPFGSVGTVSYSLTLARGILVPVSAIQTNEDQNFIYAVENGTVVMRPITVLAETGVATAVSGVPAGTVAIVNPPPGLIEGSAVTPIPAQGQAAAGASGPGAARQGGQGQRQATAGGPGQGPAQGAARQGGAP